MRVLACRYLGSWLLVAALATLTLAPTLTETQQEPGPTGIQRAVMLDFEPKGFIIQSTLDVN